MHLSPWPPPPLGMMVDLRGGSDPPLGMMVHVRGGVFDPPPRDDGGGYISVIHISNKAALVLHLAKVFNDFKIKLQVFNPSWALTQSHPTDRPFSLHH